MAGHAEKASVREWTDLLSRCRFGTVKVAGKNLTSAKIKAVAFRLAMYADADGSRVRPGIARLAVDVEVDPGTAKRAVQHLVRVGLLQLVRAGARPGHADEYQLVFPADLLEDVEVWSPVEHGREVERLRDRLRGRYASKPVDPIDPEPTDLRVPETPAEEATCGSLKHPQVGSEGPNLRVPEGPAETDLRVPQGLTCGSLGDPPPTKDLDTTTTEPTQPALDTAVTATREGPPHKDPDFAADRELSPARCPTHGLAGGVRPDGQARCPLCRALARIDAGDPTIPHLRLVQGGAA